MKRFLPIFLFFIISISLVLADNSNYPYTGGDDLDYSVEGTTSFNELTNASYIGKVLNSPKYQPLIDNLDNSGEKEIIVVDGQSLRIYRRTASTTVDIIDVYDLGVDDISPPYIYDIDGDSDKDIIIFDESAQDMMFFDFNGSHLSQSEVSIGGNVAGDSMIGCEATQNCFMVHNDLTETSLYIRHFNDTGVSPNNLVASSGGVSNFCLANLKNIVFEDIDADGNNEIIFTALKVTSSNEEGYVWSSYYENGTYTVEWVTSQSVSDYLTRGDFICRAQNYGRYISSPLVFDFDDKIAGNEIIYGLSKNLNEFKMYSYESDGDFNDDYPETFDADGTLISNPIKMSAFSDTGAVDVCVLGFDESDNEIDLLCASERSGDFSESKEFQYDITTTLTHNSTKYSNLNHGIQAKSDLEDGANLHEIITTFGVFELDLALDNVLDIVWENPKIDSAIVPVDYDDDGRNELIMVSQTNLWFATDGFINSNCDSQNCIIEMTTNPSINGVMKINTTFHITVTVEDIDEDLVNAKVDLYVGDTNEQSTGWSVNGSSGTTFTFTELQLNKTINNGVMKVYARELDDISKVEELSFTFSVANEGSEFGDSLFTFTQEPEDEEVAEGDPDLDDNAITNTINTLSSMTGLGSSLWFLFVMVVVAIAVFISAINTPSFKSDHMGALIIFIGIIELLALIIGVKLGLISTGVIITIVVVALAIVGIMVSRAIVGRGN